MLTPHFNLKKLGFNIHKTYKNNVKDLSKFVKSKV